MLQREGNSVFSLNLKDIQRRLNSMEAFCISKYLENGSTSLKTQSL